MRISCFILLATVGSATNAFAQRYQSLSADTRPFVRVGTPRVVLEHVEIIDGTGAPPQRDRNVVIEDGKIASISLGLDEQPRNGSTILDLRGYAVMPGIVGMHDHLWFQARPNLRSDDTFDGPALRVDMPFSAPRLYLAGGVTTIRTAGSVALYTDLHVKRQIEAGVLPGPHMDVTGPYLQGADPEGTPQFMQLASAEGTVLKEGEQKLSDPNFLTRASRYPTDGLGFEKTMLDTWFRKEFPQPKKKK